MSSYYIGEDDSFTTTTNINESSESAEINSLASTYSTVHSNKRCFIWNYCEDLRPHGWKCIVTKENGYICGQYFPSTTTKGSTTNTIYHLLSHRGIVNPKTADKMIQSNTTNTPPTEAQINFILKNLI
ncbi:5424_t:CDS:2 [Entrophospora sp. SA101]|nr:5424_t:CDS:2 [Entrophospora sp. SA101]